MHVADVERGILGANGIVGGGIAIAAGAALAAQMDGKKGVAVAFFGDGASAQGVLSEVLNIAALWKLPLILCCENNGYSEFSPAAAVNAGAIVDRAKPFGVPASAVAGNDVIAVWQALAEAVARARDGHGPTLIEAKTYRFHGHVEGEGNFLKEPYRSEDEITERRRADPLLAFRARLLETKVGDEKALRALEVEVEQQVARAADAAGEQPWPEPAILDSFVLRATHAA
jgi:pyruvate dehydrogenase E1 component alpha subunit